MSITNVALVGNQGLGHTAKVHFLNLFDLDLDNSYPSGGYSAFAATVKGVIGTDKTIIAILQASAAGGYRLVYNRTTDKLMAYWCAGAGAPMEEVTGSTTLVALTNCEFLVWAK